jgi:transposase
MPQSINPLVREQVISIYKETGNYAEVSRQTDVCYHSVRRLCKRYEREGDHGLIPKYANCGPKEIKSDPLIYRSACWLKRLHGKWGADFILLKLKERYPDRWVPTSRTLQNWFLVKGLNIPKSRPPKEVKKWAKEAHDTWQIDAKEQQKTQDGTPCVWLTITDEKTGALLSAPSFPL